MLGGGSSGCGGGGCAEPVLHDVVTDEAGLLLDEMACGEDGEVGDTADVVASGQLGVALGVDLEDEGLPGHVGGGAGDLGGGGAAGATPLGPEVDEDGDAGVAEDVVEEGEVDGERLAEWWEGVFAGSAAAGVGEVVGVDAVLLLAVFTGSDDGHVRLRGAVIAGAAR